MAPMPETSSTLFKERVSQFVSLPPAALAAPLPALCASVFSPLLLSYFAPARGIVLAYEDVTLSSSPSASHDPSEPVMLRHIDEYAAPFFWATATFLVWRPQRNARVDARVAHQSKTHITLSYLNVFPISILAAHLPPSWTFRTEATQGHHAADEGGVWISEGEEVAGDLTVRLLDFDARTDGRAKGKGVRLEGSLVSEEEERRREKGKSKGKGKEKRGILKRTQSGQEAEE